MKEDNSSRKRLGKPQKKTNHNTKFSEEDMDVKKLNKQYKHQRQIDTEQEEEWENWDKYYNH